MQGARNQTLVMIGEGLINLIVCCVHKKFRHIWIDKVALTFERALGFKTALDFKANVVDYWLRLIIVADAYARLACVIYLQLLKQTGCAHIQF